VTTIITKLQIQFQNKLKYNIQTYKLHKYMQTDIKFKTSWSKRTIDNELIQINLIQLYSLKRQGNINTIKVKYYRLLKN